MCTYSAPPCASLSGQNTAAAPRWSPCCWHHTLFHYLSCSPPHPGPLGHHSLQPPSLHNAGSYQTPAHGSGRGHRQPPGPFGRHVCVSGARPWPAGSAASSACTQGWKTRTSQGLRPPVNDRSAQLFDLRSSLADQFKSIATNLTQLFRSKSFIDLYLCAQLLKTLKVGVSR